MGRNLPVKRKRRKPQSIRRVITQIKIQQYIEAVRAVREADRKFNRVRAALIKALERNALIEPGPLKIELQMEVSREMSGCASKCQLPPGVLDLINFTYAEVKKRRLYVTRRGKVVR